MKKEISFKNNKGQTLMGDLYVPEEKYKLKYPAVIVCHGLGGNKDAQNKVDLSEALSKKGFIVLRFDYSGHGKSEGNYEDTTVTQIIMDIQSAIEALYSLNKVDRKKLGLVGHSIGAVAAIIEAAKDTKIKAAAAIGAFYDPIKPMRACIKNKKECEAWANKGMAEVEGGQLKYEFLKDFKKYDILNLAKKIKIPFLLVHGLNDHIVAQAQAQKIAKAAKLPIKIVEETHIFDKKAIEPVVVWFDKHLR
ncbi:lysophospholipase [Candidatus Woesearchaeota archaeon]|nr:lysophospholipase [Candidatus Woesearchaeota archaeon]MBW3005762.1 lysophospholipase [Candidatus Woesearchaeota archaeon]